jgi:hypothetical protein
LNIAFLNKNGHKISKIASLPPATIMQKVTESCNVGGEQTENVDSLFLSMYELDEHKFIKIINHKIAEEGFENTMVNTIYPFLDKLSLIWMSGSIKNIHENFVTSIIKRKINVEIDLLDPVFNPDADRFLLYLPSHEEHELSLLYVHYVLRKAGANVLYLANQTPLIDLIESYRIYKPQYIFTIFNDSISDGMLQPYIDDLIKFAPDARLLISGYQTLKQRLNPYPNVTVIEDINKVVDVLTKHRAKSK